jgi:hypothetical protein
VNEHLKGQPQAYTPAARHAEDDRVPMSGEIEGAAAAAVMKVLEPLARLALDNGLGVGDVVRLLERAFVRAAENSAEAQQGKPSDTEVSIRTGMTRIKVSQIREAAELDGTQGASRQPRTARVLWGWRHDPDFLDRAGQPKVLPLRGARSFTELVRRHAGDPRVRSLLQELKRVKSVRQRPDGLVELVGRGDPAVRWDADGITTLGESAQELLETLLYNLHHPRIPRFHRRVVNAHVKPAEAPRLVRDLGRQANSLADAISDALMDEDVTVKPADSRQEATFLSLTFFLHDRDIVVEPVSTTSDKSGRESHVTAQLAKEATRERTVPRRHR